jgi:aspartate racemase
VHNAWHELPSRPSINLVDFETFRNLGRIKSDCARDRFLFHGPGGDVLKRIGIIGGLSAESTTHFYSSLTRLYVERFNRTNYPEVVIFSVQFEKFINWSKTGEWDKFADGLIRGLKSLEAAGVDFAVISANMPHVVYDKVVNSTSLPMLHIADAIADEAHAKGYRRVGLMGTLPTMAASFYPDRLKQFGIECMVPNEEQQCMIQEVLDNELFKGIIHESSRNQYIEIIRSLKAQGAEAVILGCTEIPLLISEENSPLPVLDSTKLFVAKTLESALE